MTGKISEDTDAGTLGGTEIVPVVASGANKRTTIAKILTYIAGAKTMPTRQVFTSSSGTYTTPAGCRQLRVRMVGGGGGGGGSGTSAGGASNGSDSTFGSFTAKGATGSTGGVASGGNLNLSGGSGSGAANVSPGWGGAAGGTPLGNTATASPNNVGRNGPANSGAGGGGAGTNATNPTGAGGGGGAYIEFFINNPSATYSYAVGGGGTGGAAGTGGQAGGNGAAGIIIVDEIY